MQATIKKVFAVLLSVILTVLLVPAAMAEPVTKIRLSHSSARLLIGETKELSVTFYPAGANDAVSWTSGNTAVARVDASGLVTAVGAGFTTVRATTAGGKTTSCSVTVTAHKSAPDVTAVGLYPETATLRVGEAIVIAPVVTPSLLNNEQLEWRSGNDDIAEVNIEGRVMAIAPGTVYITASSSNGVYGRCTVVVLSGQETGKKTTPATVVQDSGTELGAATAKAAVTTAISAGSGKIAVAAFAGKSVLSPTVAGVAAHTAKELGGAVRLRFDTPDANKKLKGYLLLDPALVTANHGSISTSVRLDSKSALAAAERFGKTKAVAIDCAQRGSYGQQVTVGVKADFPGMDTAALRFYSYDAATGSHAPLKTSYKISGGWLRFTTATGGIILVTDKPL